jgi:hypothetical protein
MIDASRTTAITAGIRQSLSRRRLRGSTGAVLLGWSGACSS